MVEALWLGAVLWRPWLYDLELSLASRKSGLFEFCSDFSGVDKGCLDDRHDLFDFFSSNKGGRYL